jgi:predicted nucleotidyltransferase
MKRAEVIRILLDRLNDLQTNYAVKTLALFGSVARDEAQPGSDVDLLVEFSRPVGLFHFFRLQDYLESQLSCKVDLGTPDSLKPRLREHVLREAIRVA